MLNKPQHLIHLYSSQFSYSQLGGRKADSEVGLAHSMCKRNSFVFGQA